MVLYLPFQGTPALLSLDTAKPLYSDVDDESLHVYPSAQEEDIDGDYFELEGVELWCLMIGE